MIKANISSYKIYFLLILFVCSSLAQAQSAKQKQLEERRRELTRQISQFERLMSQGKKEQTTILSSLDNINYKISVRQNLIRNINQQANNLTREINNNQKEITNLRNRLQILKDEYAAMIVKSYKSRSEESKIMFLLSSNNFQQAYKRLQYIKQYANYQKKQGEEIKLQTIKLQELNKNLQAQKQEKQKLIEANRLAKKELDKELKEYEGLMASVSKNLSKYKSQIRTKQQEADRIDKEIEKIIRAAISASNKKAGKSSSSKTFALTPEEELLASSFVANKGKLPWPVSEGFIKVPFGTKPSPIDRTVKITNNGVRIETNKGEKVRAVFNGTVNSVVKQNNGNNIVMIQHGNYFTIYKNLSKIYVQKGDKVTTKQDIGEVRTNKASGEAILSFGVWKGLEKQNPAYWIKR
ncbi:peptidoglycan DD-metalloendopeptidase family protein [Flavobacteriaceae bacterium S0825]|uniref:murein hydrolase activator EnvC family protein n=1 Tax=Gaetbulibacter sp. S0825 TaxID=2720084 RepID=UPI001431D160|nr:peptidoglycan DD-metalloendopeptidase family protein [Gaetbulibacter sp. S0825]MCK0108328.1 peptidoglycan DD-metalloendopeptidase family protein [Flavobacteriaceae bacterium S0825]NIX63964.1 peptidoglycan DD-metalloendopeptidase family protein [Gaetbulibacter sp. S0825]